MGIDFSFEEDAMDFGLDEDKTVKWLFDIIQSENKTVGAISYFFCSDEYLLEINQKYLNHDSYTDIITFDYVEENRISGDILISLERVRENAEEYRTSFRNELNRVMAHGILHLLGYKDKSSEEQGIMRQKEDYYLTLQPSK